MRLTCSILKGLTAIMAALSLTDCAQEELQLIASEGKEVILSLDCVIDGMNPVEVKNWEANTAQEQYISNLRIYIFSASTGALTGYKYFPSLSTSSNTDSIDEGYDGSVTGIKTQTGDAYIYGIANGKTSQYWASSDILDIDEGDISASGLTMDKFLSETYTRQSGALRPMDGLFLMSGFVNNGEKVTISRAAGSTKATITSPAGDLQKLRLYKALSRNTVTVNVSSDKNSKGESITFTPEYYELFNVPVCAMLIPGKASSSGNITAAGQLSASVNDAGASWKNTTSNYEDFTGSDGRTSISETSFSFYLPENWQSTTSSISTWNDREANSYTSGYKTFDNAPAYSTYIVIHGSYDGPASASSTETYSGNVTYTMHLGDFGTFGNTDKLSNFDVVRNNSYSYTITINGVNNFIAEAKCDKDDDGNSKYDHGSEGILINPAGALYNVDCHYEARVLEFDYDEINTIINTDKFGYIIKFKTPFCETKSLIVTGNQTSGNIYEAAEYKSALEQEQTPTPLATFSTDDDGTFTLSDDAALRTSGDYADYYWVHFVLNTGVTSNQQSIGSLTNSNRKISDVCRYPGDTKGKTMNVFQLMGRIYEAVTDNNKKTSFFNTGTDNSTAYVTCFIDENYYADKDWKDYVNNSDGRMFYLANTLDVSEDGKSSVSTAKYVIAQKSIWTIYSLDFKKNPFGVEYVSEEESAYAGYTVTKRSETYTQHNWNGRQVTIANVVGKSRYNNFLSGNGKHAIAGMQSQEFYSDMFQVCMSRNRDADGDGVIDEEEIKWYLGAVDEYKGIWCGEDVLTQNSRLFKDTQAEWNGLKTAYVSGKDSGLNAYHYYTTSSQCVFWAEEGCSTGTGYASKVRCLRTLQNQSEGLSDADVYYTTAKVTITDNTAGTSKTYDGITVHLADGSLRTAASSAMSSSLERGASSTNELYQSFIIDNKNLIIDNDGNEPNKGRNVFTRGEIMGVTFTGDAFATPTYITGDKDVCAVAKGAPWRVPNQREMAVMSAALCVNTSGSYTNYFGTNGFMWTNTFFTGLLPGYYKNSQSLAVGLVMNTSDGRFTIQPNGSGYVRCVADVQ